MSFFSKFNRDKLRTLKVGDEMYSLRIPEKYLWEYEDGDILAFYPKGRETITIRVAVLNFERKDAKSGDFINTVIEEAESKKSVYQHLDEETLLVENLPNVQKENDTDLIMQIWYVAKNNSLVVFTTTVILSHVNDPTVLETKRDLDEIFRSVTKL